MDEVNFSNEIIYITIYKTHPKTPNMNILFH